MTAKPGRPLLHAAVDLGASSARLLAGRLTGGRLEIEEVCRVPNGPVRLPDGLHWDLLGIEQAMLTGIAALSQHTEERLSVGIDGWGVDYGLLDAEGRLLGPPYHYRDARTTGRLEQADRLIGRAALYEATGVQEMPINTSFQLLAEKEGAAWEVATTLLLVPDLLAYLLTGERRLEITNASTTQLVDARSRDLATAVLARLGIPAALFPPRCEPGAELAPFLPAVAAEGGTNRAPLVVTVASHDTASAVLAVPAEGEDFAYVVSGTWSLVGVEVGAPVITEESRSANFSNELGVDGSVRFLKNVMGHWMIQECERSWARAGETVDLEGVLVEAAAREPFRSLVDTTEPLFAEPGDMPERVRAACRRQGELEPRDRAELVRCILDSMALAVADALERALELSGRQARVVHVVGGGARNELFCRLVAAACGREVAAGPVEASAVGNLLVQLQATGSLRGRDEMRHLVASSFRLRRFAPDPALAARSEQARARLQAVAGPAAATADAR